MGAVVTAAMMWAVGVGASSPTASVLRIVYPLPGAVFPCDIVAPEVLWNDESPATRWRITFRFGDDPSEMQFECDGRRAEPQLDPMCLREDNAPELPALIASAKGWRPAEAEWAVIRRRSLEREARIVVEGVGTASRGEVRFRTSRDPVGAPLFYRDVPLMPSRTREGVIQPIAPNALPMICWRVRRVDERESRVVLRDLPTCANCHSFAAAGRRLALDVDGPDGDKGAHAVVPLAEQVVVDRDHVFSWNAPARREGRGPDSYGLFPQVSPDGRLVAASIREALYVQNYPDWRFLQTFYPTRGVLAVCEVESRRIWTLAGADDPRYVQANPVWSPDGRWLVFARAEARDPYGRGPAARYANDPNETQIRFDLYRIPFNEGRGGEAMPLAGASRNGRSNFFPKFSPDGRWIVFVQAANGMLLRPDSELWIVPAEGGEARRMTCNLAPMNSWHSWSPNGRWLAFSSKAFGAYTKLFLAHVDEDGNDAVPVLLADCTPANRAVNLPEFLPAGAPAISRIEMPAVDYRRLMERALAAVEAGEYAAAEEFIRESLALKEDFAETHVVLGWLNEMCGRPDAADAAFRRALQLMPGHPRAHRYWAMALNRRGRPAEALGHLREALAADPEDALSYRLLGDALVALGRAEEAERAYRGAIARAPGGAEAHNNLALLLAARGDSAGAAAHLREAIRHRPDFASALANLGLMRFRDGDESEAAELLRRAVAADPRHAPAQAALGLLLATATDPRVRNGSEALRAARAAVELAGDRSPQAWAALAAARAETGDAAGALEAAARAMQLAPEGSPLARDLRDRFLPAIRAGRPVRASR
ncbi:MAG: tetratricopeptide repeat protein [Kiritimatiellae bacterium]|nr:tetratricopeptide repeat protein [Kiritimatiellia bacterium]